jgi:hypothetical protein
MRTAVLASLIVCLLAGDAAAQCCGDCDGDGVVGITELITAVNRALGSCADPSPTRQPTATHTRLPTATPTPANRCPSTFQDNRGQCFFRGRFNQGCGEELSSTFSSNGATVIVEIDTNLAQPPTVLFAAEVDNATSARLTGWSTNNFQTTHLTAGQLQLVDNGQQLVIFPNDPPFMILSCNFVRYAGNYLGVSRAIPELAGQQILEGAAPSAPGGGGRGRQ